MQSDFFPYSRLSTCILVCFCILCHCCCYHALVFGKTLVHEFPIFCIAILNGTCFLRSPVIGLFWLGVVVGAEAAVVVAVVVVVVVVLVLVLQ